MSGSEMRQLILALSFTSCAVLGKSFNFPGPRFSHQEKEDSRSSHGTVMVLVESVVVCAWVYAN